MSERLQSDGMSIDAAVGESDFGSGMPTELNAGVPEPVDEGAVTRALRVEEVITHEYVAAESESIPSARANASSGVITNEYVAAEPLPSGSSSGSLAEPSAVVELGDDAIARLTPVVDPLAHEPEEEGVSDRFEREPTPLGIRSPTRPTTVVGLIRPNGAVILLGLLCALAIVEAIAAFLAYREHIAEQDWQAAAELLAEHEGEPVIVASEWLGPNARMYLPQTRSFDSLAFPDLRGFPRFWLLTHENERPWAGALRDELEELPRPRLLAVHRLGELTLHEYQQPVGTLQFSALDSIQAVSTNRGPCTGSGHQFKCKEGRVSVRLLEIDYRVRRCIALELDDGVLATIDLGEVELGDRLYGHVGFGDFNARLRSDPSARLEVRINDVIAGRWVFSDDQGWAAFALATAPGRHRVELQVGTSVAGTWQRDGYRSSPNNVLCVELRGFDESSRAGEGE